MSRVRYTEYYEFMEIAPGSNKEDIRKAFKRKAAQWHPDRNPAQEENFKRLQKVYEVLMDDKKRATYDTHGEEGLNRPRSIFEEMNDREQKGQNFVKKIGVDLSDLYKGLAKKLKIKKKLICPECAGIGTKDKANAFTCRHCGGEGKQVRLMQAGMLVQQVVVPCQACRGVGQMIKDPCVRCGGEKTIQGQDELELVINPGQSHGQKVVFTQAGDQEPGVTPGDIIFVLHELPNETFKRKGADLYVKQWITLREALCGWNAYLVHMDGRVLHLKTQPGEVIRPGPSKVIPGEGMPLYRRAPRKGRLFLDFEIEFPASGSLSAEQVAALSKALPGPGSHDLAQQVYLQSQAAVAKEVQEHKRETEEVEILDVTPDILAEGEEMEKAQKEVYEEDEEEEERGPGVGCAQQ